MQAVLDLVVAFAALDGLCVNHSRIAGGFFLRGKVGDHQKHQDCHENQRGQGVHRRLDASAHLAVDQAGYGIHPGTSCKVRNDKIIEGHRKCHQKAGEDTRDDVRKYDLEESI